MARPDALLTARLDARPLEMDINKIFSKNHVLNVSVARNNGLGTISRDATDFEKSLKAAEARVLAFGATTGIINLVASAFKNVVSSTLEVEKSLADINVILNATTPNLAKFGDALFDIAGKTGQSFSVVAETAKEFSRQGLGVEQTLKRTEDSMILLRLSGLSAADSVEAITASLNSFQKEALTSTEVVNKLAAVDQSFAVSSADLAEAIKRVGSTANDAGVSLDELLGIVTAVQQTTSRGGAVIGNALKTIFTRISDNSSIAQLKELGVNINNSQNGLQKLQAISEGVKLNPEYANEIKKIAGGVFQINVVSAALQDLSREYNVTTQATKLAANATDEANQRNEKLNVTLSALTNQTLSNLTNLSAKLGQDLFGPSIRGILTSINDAFSAVKQADSDSLLGLGTKVGEGLIKGLGDYISGPGIAIVSAVLGKIFFNFATFAKNSIQGLFKINDAAKNQENAVLAINNILNQQPKILSDVLNGTTSVLEAERQVLNILNQQYVQRERQALVAASIAKSILSGTAPVSSSISKQNPSGGFSTGPAPAPIKKASHGLVPNFVSKDESKAEKVGAALGGYTATQIKKMDVPKLGKVIYNTREKVVDFGMEQPAIMPPSDSKAGFRYKEDFKKTHGFDPYIAAKGMLPYAPKYSDGLIPNFAKILGKGAFGVFSDLEKTIGGVPVGIKKFNTTYPGKSGRKIETAFTSKNEIAKEFEVSKMLEGLNQKVNPIFNFPKIFGNKERSVERERIGKQIISGKTLLDANVTGDFAQPITNLLEYQLPPKGLIPDDLHRGNFVANDKFLEIYKKIASRGKTSDVAFQMLRKVKNADRISRAIARQGGKLSLIDAGNFSIPNRTSFLPEKKQSPVAEMSVLDRFLTQKGFAGGLVPNYARFDLPKISKSKISHRLLANFEKGQDYKDFYQIIGDATGGGERSVAFGGIASALSPKVPDYLAGKASVTVFKEFLGGRGQNVDDYLDLDFDAGNKIRKIKSLGFFGPKGARRAGLSKALSGQTLARAPYDKTRQYAQALSGDKDAFPIDTNVLSTVFGKNIQGTLTAGSAERLIDIARSTAGKAGIETRQLQAGIFKGANTRFQKQYTPEYIASLAAQLKGITGGFSNGLIPNYVFKEANRFRMPQPVILSRASAQINKSGLNFKDYDVETYYGGEHSQNKGSYRAPSIFGGRPSQIEINSRADEETYRHEYGHFIDNMMGIVQSQGKNKDNGNPNYFSDLNVDKFDRKFTNKYPDNQKEFFANFFSRSTSSLKTSSFGKDELFLEKNIESFFKQYNKGDFGSVNDILKAYQKQYKVISSPGKQTVVPSGEAFGIKKLEPIFSDGLIPLDKPILEAISREKAAGVPMSQIRVGQNNSLVSNQNPQGVGVYNLRDEPRGISQGIARVASQGFNPKKYIGAANGLVPNFVDVQFNDAVRGAGGKFQKRNDSVEEEIKKQEEVIAALDAYKASIRGSQANQEEVKKFVDNLGTQYNLTQNTVKKLNSSINASIAFQERVSKKIKDTANLGFRGRVPTKTETAQEEQQAPSRKALRSSTEIVSAGLRLKEPLPSFEPFPTTALKSSIEIANERATRNFQLQKGVQSFTIPYVKQQENIRTRVESTQLQSRQGKEQSNIRQGVETAIVQGQFPPRNFEASFRIDEIIKEGELARNAIFENAVKNLKNREAERLRQLNDIEDEITRNGRAPSAPFVYTPTSREVAYQAKNTLSQQLFAQTSRAQQDFIGPKTPRGLINENLTPQGFTLNPTSEQIAQQKLANKNQSVGSNLKNPIVNQINPRITSLGNKLGGIGSLIAGSLIEGTGGVIKQFVGDKTVGARNANSVIDVFTSALSSGSAGGAVGSSFGPKGAVIGASIGAAIGGIGSLSTAIKNWGSTLVDLQRKLEDVNQSSSFAAEGISKYAEITEKLRSVSSGESNLSPDAIRKLQNQQIESLNQARLTDEQRTRLQSANGNVSQINEVLNEVLSKNKSESSALQASVIAKEFKANYGDLVRNAAGGIFSTGSVTKGESLNIEGRSKFNALFKNLLETENSKGEKFTSVFKNEDVVKQLSSEKFNGEKFFSSLITQAEKGGFEDASLVLQDLKEATEKNKFGAGNKNILSKEAFEAIKGVPKSIELSKNINSGVKTEINQTRALTNQLNEELNRFQKFVFQTNLSLAENINIQRASATIDKSQRGGESDIFNLTASELEKSIRRLNDAFQDLTQEGQLAALEIENNLIKQVGELALNSSEAITSKTLNKVFEDRNVSSEGKTRITKEAVSISSNFREQAFGVKNATDVQSLINYNRDIVSSINSELSKPDVQGDLRSSLQAEFEIRKGFISKLSQIGNEYDANLAQAKRGVETGKTIAEQEKEFRDKIIQFNKAININGGLSGFRPVREAGNELFEARNERQVARESGDIESEIQALVRIGKIFESQGLNPQQDTLGQLEKLITQNLDTQVTQGKLTLAPGQTPASVAAQQVQNEFKGNGVLGTVSESSFLLTTQTDELKNQLDLFQSIKEKQSVINSIEVTRQRLQIGLKNGLRDELDVQRELNLLTQKAVENQTKLAFQQNRVSGDRLRGALETSRQLEKVVAGTLSSNSLNEAFTSQFLNNRFDVATEKEDSFKSLALNTKSSLRREGEAFSDPALFGSSAEQFRVINSLIEQRASLENKIADKVKDSITAQREYTAEIRNQLAVQAEVSFKQGRITGDRLRQARSDARLAKKEVNGGKLSGGGISDAFFDQFKYNTRDLYDELEQGAADVGSSLKSGFKDAFKSFADGTKSAESALASFGIGILSKLGDKAFDIATNSIFNVIGSSISSGFGRAKGGPVKGYSTGGVVTGGSGVKDDVPAKLTEGEYVIKKSAVQRYGIDFLDSINEASALYDGNTTAVKANVNGQSINAVFKNSFQYDKPDRPTKGDFNIDPALSVAALEDENNPQNKIRQAREEALGSYLRDAREYEKSKQAQIDAFRTQRRRALQAAYIQAGISAVGLGISAYASGAFGKGAATTTAVAGATGNTLVSQPYSAGVGYSNPTVAGGSQVLSAVDYNQFQTNPQAFGFSSTQNFNYSRPSAGLGYSYGVGYRRAGGGMIQKFAGGGMPKTYGGTTAEDNIPALLMGGEYVVKKNSVSHYGKDFFDKLNRGQIKKFADGGYVTPNQNDFASAIGSSSSKDVSAMMAEFSKIATNIKDAVSSINKSSSTPGGMTNNINIDIKIDKAGNEQSNVSTSSKKANESKSPEDKKLEEERSRAFGERIHSTIRQVIISEQRPGGLLYGN